jgi:hypothetical protein
LALIAERGTSSDLLKQQGATEKEIIAAIREFRKGATVDSQTSNQEFDALGKYAINLNELARSGRLDPVIGKSIVSFCPMGCKTGFYLSTMNNVTAEQIREALAGVYKSAFPLKSKEDIVGLNEVQCGNPGLFAVASTNRAMAQYMRCLYTPEQAEEAGIGSIYNCAY